ncbi:hypothetical protein ACFFV7_53695 [Nonomuraea spiralis]|uniref:Uncharacterized protein n=1 Tax=Nonomuraea spiralis TaxID=46182 RepID=A0ABV5J1F5_9ACTN|nr:hypothetical protein [Nonomuraea spiralis]GGT16566.1 hypothetical protein GCM10010176_071350 [Nonomuraea spiralis]
MADTPKALAPVTLAGVTRQEVGSLHAFDPFRRFRPQGARYNLASPTTVIRVSRLRAALPSELEAGRSAWQEEKLAYATARREAKQRGQRGLHPDDINLYTPTCWYGACREAALHAVSFWHQRRLAVLLVDDDRPASHPCPGSESAPDGPHRPDPSQDS